MGVFRFSLCGCREARNENGFLVDRASGMWTVRGGRDGFAVQVKTSETKK